MEKNNLFARWIVQIRATFLVLSVVLVALGVAMAYLTGVNKPFWYSILLVIGVTLSHISVNLFNEYFDFKTKIDFNVKRTPFSGGTGSLTSGTTNPNTVLVVAIITLLLAFGIGVFFCAVTSWLLMIIIAIGGLSVVLYTTVLSKVMLGEIVAGLALGSLVIIGTYYVMTDSLPLWVVILSIPSGILTTLLAYLNNFPDVEADIQGGRHHLVIQFGRKLAAQVYTIAIIVSYLIIVVSSVVFNTVGVWILTGLLTVPLSIQACRIVLKQYDNIPALIPAMGMNVMIVLGTNVTLTLGVVLQILI